MERMIKELGEIITGNTPSKEIGEFWNSKDICFIKPDIISDDRVNTISESNEYVSKAAKKKARVVTKDAVFVTCIGSIGKIGIASEGEYAFNQQINAIVPNKKIIPRYLAYDLFFNKPRLFAIANAPVVPIINKSQFGEFTINMEEDIHKQSKIVNVLDKLTHIIEKRVKELSMLDDLIKARFVELFGDSIKNPKGWDVVKLSECLERIDNGKSFTCDSNAREGAFPAILKLSAATYGDYRPYENKALLDEKQFVESVEVHRGDLLFTRKNTPDLVGMAAYVFETPEKLMMPDLIFRLVTNERMTPIFLWQLINNREFRPVIQGISGGSAKSMSNISKERLKNIEVICPPISEQKKLEGVLEQVNKSKVVVQKALDETQKLFDSLMQQYFG